MIIALSGDIALHGMISSQPELNGERYGWLESELNKYDGVFANLETPVEGNDRNKNKKTHLFADPSVTIDILKRLNILCVSLANNHILDCGQEGLEKTIRILDRLGIYHTGAGLNVEQARPIIFEHKGRRIGFASYVDKSTNTGSESDNGIFLNVFDEKETIKDINFLKKQSDIVIVSIHWGKDYSFYPERWQVEAARNLIDAGAGIIMGHHSHTLQTFERYNSGLIFYGLGSLTFGDFIRNGRPYALFRKTKNSAVFALNEACEIVKTVPVHERKSNIIVPWKRNISRRNRVLSALNIIRESSRLTKALFRFNEDVLYRVFEYFFGYYMNPLKRLLQIGNIKKIRKLFR